MYNRKRDGHLFASPSLSLCLFKEGWSLNLLGWFLPLNLPPREVHRDEMMESWGIGFLDRSIHLTWGHLTKFIHLPWDWNHIKHEVMRPDGTWVPFVGSWETGPGIPNTDGVMVIKGGKEPDGRWTASYPYRYTLRSGEVQERIATICVERREWRWRWLRFLTWPSIKRQCIDVEFNDEVGEGTGSWKGGTIGCGYDMKPGEDAIDTLWRMERERVFN